MLNFRYGPDGGVFAIDWYDKNQCHSSNPEIHQKTLGRIFKISHDNDKMGHGRSPEAVVGQAGRAAAPSQRLVRAPRAAHPAGARARSDGARRAQAHPARESRRDAQAARALGAARHRRVERTGARSSCSGHDSEYVRSWAVYLLVAGKNPSDGRRCAGSRSWRDEDTSALVRLYLASALQRVPSARDSAGTSWRRSSRTAKTPPIRICR